MNNAIDEKMELDQEIKRMIENYISDYEIKKYIIFDNSTIKYPITEIENILLYPAECKYGIGEDIRNKGSYNLMTQSADIMINYWANSKEIKVMYVKSGIAKNKIKEYLPKIKEDLDNCNFLLIDKD